jgi:hypothetical protein
LQGFTNGKDRQMTYRVGASSGKQAGGRVKKVGGFEAIFEPKMVRYPSLGPR